MKKLLSIIVFALALSFSYGQDNLTIKLGEGGGGGDFIPMTGTVDSTLVTGVIRVEDGFALEWTASPEYPPGNPVITANNGVMQIGDINHMTSNGVLIIDNNGAPEVTISGFQLIMDAYGAGSFTGTPTYSLQVDVSGNVIEVPVVKTTDNYANDAAAAIGGIAVGRFYHTSGVVKIRLL